MFLSTIAITLFILYSILIIFYWRSWESIPIFSDNANGSSIRISVIIPARNEEMRIGPLLEALRQQTYPAELFEVIVIDDHSTDKTAEIVQRFSPFRLIRLESDLINSYKKKALEYYQKSVKIFPENEDSLNNIENLMKELKGVK